MSESLMLVTALNPHIGRFKAQKLLKTLHLHTFQTHYFARSICIVTVLGNQVLGQAKS